jgi:hypothetical protein
MEQKKLQNKEFKEAGHSLFSTAKLQHTTEFNLYNSEQWSDSMV